MISSIRRKARKQCRSCSADSLSTWLASLARKALAGWMRSPRCSSTAVTGCWASQSISSPGWSLRSSSAMAASRRAWPRPIGDEMYSARFGRDDARRQRDGLGRGPTNSRISVLTRTGWRACGRWPAPSSVARDPPDASARATALAYGDTASSVPWMTKTGHETRLQTSSTSCSVCSSPISSSVSGVVSSPQPTQSSMCFVECGSVKHRPKKNSRKPL